MSLNSKERAKLMSLANSIDPIFNVGKGSVTPEMIEGIAQALEKRELIKIGVLKNCANDPKDIANLIAERTHSTVVKVIGKKIVLYKRNNKDPKIELK
ncbi:MAG: ribosome assembly RNA-binding protein YhbY [Lachnospiraceae bacterium]|nr:ribosome assembly RNA-binding protein YhbY [Lachnospiraceae bacterium]